MQLSSRAGVTYPADNLRTGTSLHLACGAIACCSQVRARASTLLLGVQMGQLPDAKFLRGFATATAHRLSALGAHGILDEAPFEHICTCVGRAAVQLSIKQDVLFTK